MMPYEIMLSESQERMLAIVEPQHLAALLAITERWEITAAVVGTVTAGGTLRILDRPDGEVLADRKRRLETGEATVSNWDEAKKRLQDLGR